MSNAEFLTMALNIPSRARQGTHPSAATERRGLVTGALPPLRVSACQRLKQSTPIDQPGEPTAGGHESDSLTGSSRDSGRSLIGGNIWRICIRRVPGKCRGPEDLLEKTHG